MNLFFCFFFAFDFRLNFMTIYHLKTEQLFSSRAVSAETINRQNSSVKVETSVWIYENNCSGANTISTYQNSIVSNTITEFSTNYSIVLKNLLHFALCKR